ncbi:CYTH domain-containing protein [Paraglaciecola hydrolytica]|uniref:CYTH domain-containing protein n=1 Tax=Paraglaciecola hydrolytica TaxID=1799789 RepID=A0A136A2Z3_9ALTE|nr:CYTH domain-containing protein [Paraglaciecola hydrolytica]KXI29605.1 hypothetical protein AX660_06010 [Paraglaciecola hydrolytica]
MEYEIELKLTTTVQAGEFIENSLLPKLAAKVEQQELELSNSYFDTSERDFRLNGMGLRIRGCQHEYEQTIKTAGKGVAGLQQRPEYNVDLGKLPKAPETPDLSLFPAEVWPVGFDHQGAQTQLQCLFVTQFKRSVYLLNFNPQSQIELVWDRGEVRANDKCDEINEIELELKAGNISEIFNVARQLATIMPLKIGLLSKAARGYRLLNGGGQADKTLPEPLNLLTEEQVKHSSRAQLHSLVAKRLSRWQKLLNYFEMQPSQACWHEINTVWQQLSLVLAQCCKQGSDNSQSLHCAMQDFQHQWQGVVLSGAGNSQTATPSHWHAAVEVLTGSSALLMQLAIMQYLVEQQAV